LGEGRAAGEVEEKEGEKGGEEYERESLSAGNCLVGWGVVAHSRTQ